MNDSLPTFNLLLFLWENINLVLFSLFIIYWLFYSRLKDFFYKRYDRELQIINPDYTKHPKRSLSHTEHEILKRLSQDFFSNRFLTSSRLLQILFGLFLIFSTACYIFIVTVGLIVDPLGLPFLLAPIIIGSLIAIKKTLGKHAEYYLDLRSPVFEMTTRLFIVPSTKKQNKRYKLRDLFFSASENSEFISALENYSEGTLIRIEYSPHSKHVWSLEKIGL